MNYKPFGKRLIIRIITCKEIEIAGQKLTIAKGVNQYGKSQKEWEQDLWAEVIKLGRDITPEDDLKEGDVIFIQGSAGRWIDADIAKSAATHRIIDYYDVLMVDPDKKALLTEHEASNHA